MQPESIWSEVRRSIHRTIRPRARRLAMRAGLAGGLILVLLLAWPRTVFLADDPEPPKSIRMTCGTCPSGYALTGVTTAPEICKEGDPTLVECVPIGSMNLLAVCGSCPEGYVEVGSSRVPARGGNADGGRMSQCQLQQSESGLPNPSQGSSSALLTAQGKCRRRGRAPYHVHPRCRLPRKSRN